MVSAIKEIKNVEMKIMGQSIIFFYFFFSVRMATEGLFEGMMFKEEWSQPCQKLQGKVCQAEGLARAKALEQEKPWLVKAEKRQL